MNDDNFTKKHRRKKLRLKKNLYVNVKSRIDTGLSREGDSRRGALQRRDTVAKKTVVKNVPKMSNLKDLICLGRRIKMGERFTKINNEALSKCYIHLIDLDELIGLESLKSTIFDQVIYFLQDLNKIARREFLHTCLTGSSGVGKTEVAKILSRLYASLGTIENPTYKFKIAHREDLVASYLGQTATKTLDLLNSCLGGVLFIDEVYALGSGVEGKDSFSKEAVDTLCGFLSENAGKFVCIIAGYEKDVKRCFFNLNQGLESRFPWVHKLEDYSPTQLARIFKKQVTKIKWSLKSDDEEKILHLVEENADLFKKGQGRAVRNFIVKCKIQHSRRNICDPHGKSGHISYEDVSDAIASFKSTKDEESESFQSMYS